MFATAGGGLSIKAIRAVARSAVPRLMDIAAANAAVERPRGHDVESKSRRERNGGARRCDVDRRARGRPAIPNAVVIVARRQDRRRGTGANDAHPGRRAAHRR